MSSADQCADCQRADFCSQYLGSSYRPDGPCDWIPSRFVKSAHVDTEEKAARDRILAALEHCVEVMRDLTPVGHEGDEESGEHPEDCALCRIESALAHAEAVLDHE